MRRVDLVRPRHVRRGVLWRSALFAIPAMLIAYLAFGPDRGDEPAALPPESSRERAARALAAGDFAVARAALAEVLRAQPDGDDAQRLRFQRAVALLEGDAPDPAAALEEFAVLDRSATQAGKEPPAVYIYYRGLARRGQAREALAAAGIEGVRERVLVPQGDTWRYFEGRKEPPAAWRGDAFEDGDWQEGEGGFGFRDEDDRTVLEDMEGQYFSLYLRRRFELPRSALTRAEGLLLRVYFDDGFVAYLGGKEIARGNMPGPPGVPVPHNAFAPGSHEAEGYEEFVLVPPALAAGVNTLAIQAHQASPRSTDFSIDAELVLIERAAEDSSTDATDLLKGAIADLERALAGLEQEARAAAPGDERNRREARARQARLDLADALLLAGRPQDVRSLLEPNRKRGGEAADRPALYVLGAALLAAGDILGAGELLSRLEPFSASPQDEHAAYLLARIHHRLGERPEALALYEAVAGGRATTSGPGRSRAVGAAGGRPRQMAGEPGQAGEWRATGRPGRAAAGRRAQVAARPPLAAHHLLAELFRAAALFELGRAREAREALEEFEARYARWPLAAAAGVFHGITLFEEENHETAVNVLLGAAARTGDNGLKVRAYLWAARNLAAQALKAGAEASEMLLGRADDCLERALLFRSPPAEARAAAAELATTFLIAGRPAEAAVRLGALAAEDGDGAPLSLLYPLAVSFELGGRPAEAGSLCRRLLEANPGSAYEGALRFRVGEAHFQQALLESGAEAGGAGGEAKRREHLEAAMQSYQAARASGVSFPERNLASLRLGLCALFLGRTEDAGAALAAMSAGRKGDEAAAAALRGRLILAREPEPSGGRRFEDAVTAARSLASLEEAAALLEKALKLAETEKGAGGAWLGMARLSLVQAHRRRGEILALPQARREALARALEEAARIRRESGSQPLSAAAILEEGKALAAMGNLPAAVARLRLFRDLAPWKLSAAAPEGHLVLARVLRAAGKLEDADRTLAAVRARGDAPELALEHARLMQAQGRAPEARAVLAALEQPAEGAPADPVTAAAGLELARLELAEAEAALGAAGGRDEGLQDAAGRAQETLRRLSRALKTARERDEGARSAAEILLDIGRAANVLQGVWMRRDAAGKETAANSGKEGAADGGGPRAAFDLAAGAFREVLRLRPSGDDLRLEAAAGLAGAWARRGDAARAVGLLEEAAASSTRKEQDGEILLRLGAAFLEGGEPGKALATFEAAQALAPRGKEREGYMARLLLGAAMAREGEGDSPGALALLAEASKAGDQWGLRASFRQGVISLQAGRKEEALPALTAAAAGLRDAEERAAALYELARASLALGEAARSAEILEEILLQYPATPAGLAALRHAQEASEPAPPLADSGAGAHAILAAPWTRRETMLPLGAPVAPPAPAEAVVELAAEIESIPWPPAPFAPIEAADPRALLRWLTLEPEPPAPAVAPARDATLFLEDWK